MYVYILYIDCALSTAASAKLYVCKLWTVIVVHDTSAVAVVSGS